MSTHPPWLSKDDWDRIEHEMQHPPPLEELQQRTLDGLKRHPCVIDATIDPDLPDVINVEVEVTLPQPQPWIEINLIIPKENEDGQDETNQ